MNRMKRSIRTRLFTPLAVLMLMLPVIVYVTFGIVTSEYAMGLSRAAISSTLKAVSSIVDRVYDEAQGTENAGQSSDETLRIQAREFLYETRRAIRHSQFDSSIIVLNRKFAPLFPSEIDEETAAIIAHYSGELDAPTLGVVQEHFERLTINGQDYMACMLMLRDPEEVLNNYLIVYSSISDTGMLLRAAGLLVLILTGMLALTALLVSWLAVTSVAQPIKRLSEHVARIGAGDFTITDQVSSVREIDALLSATNRMSRKLKSYDEAQKSFFQNASHELRTPLMSIQGYAEGIELGVLDDSQHAASVIAQESRRLTQIVDSLLTLSRMDNGQQDVEIEQIPLLSFLENTVERLRGLTMQNAAELVILPGTPDLCVLADEQLMYKAVMNVLSNALRYAHSKVTLSIVADDGHVILRVADDGPGIPPEDAPRIFDRFFRGMGGQNGIGLSIVKAVMEYMDGSIGMAPSDMGAAFELRFQAAKQI